MSNPLDQQLTCALMERFPALISQSTAQSVAEKLMNPNSKVFTVSGKDGQGIVLEGDAHAVHISVAKLLHTVSVILEPVLSPEKRSLASAFALLSILWGIRELAEPVSEDEATVCSILVRYGTAQQVLFRKLSREELRSLFGQTLTTEVEERLEKAIAGLSHLKCITVQQEGGEEYVSLKEVCILRLSPVERYPFVPKLDS